MAKRLTVVLSQGQTHNPAKRDLEENIVAALIMEPGIDVVVVPHLYDLPANSTGLLALSGVSGPLVVLSWLYERAARWTLDRAGVRGQAGITLLPVDSDDEAEEDHANANNEEAASTNDKVRVLDQREIPKRKIYCLDLRAQNDAQLYIAEVKRIYSEQNTQVFGLLDWVGGSPSPQQLQRFIQPTNDTALGGPPLVPPVLRIDEQPQRRWYPVIDYSRCTNCMECIDFCLFGVYGVDQVETILVEQPDNCRKGCPACSRVCPENAIIFPQHKTPAIAGSDEVAGSMKIDLSALFGAPVEGVDALTVAARERDEQLLMAGRDAVGTTIGMPKRQATNATESKDDLDRLIDQLDELDI